MVFGDVGEVRKIAEGAHDAHGFGDRHAVEDGFEFPPGGAVLVAVETDRGLPDALDQIEDVGALLIANGIAENAAKQPYIVAQPRILFQRLRVIGAIGPDLGIGRRDLGGHGSSLQKLPGNTKAASFVPRRKTEETGASSLPEHKAEIRPSQGHSFAATEDSP
jgi:hypothetical protein